MSSPVSSIEASSYSGLYAKISMRFILPLIVIITAALPSVSFAEESGAQEQGEFGSFEDWGEVDEYGLPLITDTQREQEAASANTSSTNDSDGAGWGATARNDSNDSSGWGATERNAADGNLGWGGKTVDRRQTIKPQVACDITVDQLNLITRQAQLALASGSLARWAEIFPPLEKGGCDLAVLLHQRARADMERADANQRRDQLIANATRQSRSRLRRPGEMPPAPLGSAADWIEVANGLANLGASIKATREGRVLPAPTTIISQNPDGSIAYSLPATPQQAATAPEVTRELARRVAERRRMEQAAVDATNISSWNKITPPNPNAEADEVEGFGNPGENTIATGPTSSAMPSVVLPEGLGAAVWDPASEENCSERERPTPGAQCMCKQQLYGIPFCDWREGGESVEDPCNVLIGQSCSESGLGDLTFSYPCSDSYGLDSINRTVTWVFKASGGRVFPGQRSNYLGAFSYYICGNVGSKPRNRDTGSGMDPLEIVSSHTGADRDEAAWRTMTAAVAQCNASVRQKAESIYKTDLSSCVF